MHAVCSLRSFSQSPSGISAVVDVASDGAGSSGGIYRLSGVAGATVLLQAPLGPGCCLRCGRRPQQAQPAPYRLAAELPHGTDASCPSSLCRAVPCSGGRRAGRPAAAAGRGHGRSGCHPAPHQYPLCVAAGGQLAWLNAAAVAWSNAGWLVDAARCRASPAALTAQQHSIVYSQLPQLLAPSAAGACAQGGRPRGHALLCIQLPGKEWESGAFEAGS